MTRRFSSFRVRACRLATCLSLVGAGSAQAVDLNAQDAVAAPAGVDALLGYATYASRSSFVGTDGRKADQPTHLKSAVEILRYVHYMDLGGVRIAPQVLLPHAKLYDASLGGASLGAASGLSDPILASPVWLLHSAETHVAVIPYLYLPLGNYRAGQTLNIGENRWKAVAQVAWAQQWGRGFMTQLSADVMAYGDNNRAGTRGNATLRQDPTRQLQAWLSYVPANAPGWHLAAGYSQTMGGSQRQDGVDTGQKTEVNQARLELGTFITPSMQLLLQVQRDTHVRGGFQEDRHATVRLLKLF